MRVSVRRRTRTIQTPTTASSASATTSGVTTRRYPRRMEIEIRVSPRARRGSCAPSGTVSLNWRLALAPPAVLDYVVVHEFCHLHEANHGPRFWALVEQRRPLYRAARRWLGDHGHALLAHEPGPVDSGAWSAGRPSTATAR